MMKIKKIIGLAVALCAMLLMSVAVNAATDIKAGTLTTTTLSGTSYVIVPIELTSTDMSELSAYTIQVKYDTDKYTPARFVDKLTYEDEWGDTVNYGSSSYNLSFETGIVQFNFFVNGTVYPDPIETLTLAWIYFQTDATECLSSEFAIIPITVSDIAATNFECTSYFTFAVTGNLDGNEIVGLAASTDGGTTKQELTKYVSTTLTEDDTDYASATTNFLVAVNNTQGSNAVVDITIYGIKEDGTYVELGDYAQDDFLVQTFK